MKRESNNQNQHIKAKDKRQLKRVSTLCRTKTLNLSPDKY